MLFRRENSDELKSNFTFVHNIILVRSGPLFESSSSFSGGWSGSGLFDYNLYFNISSSITDTFPLYLSFQFWQRLGEDLNSMIDIDPLFVDVDQFDFRLQNISPALKLGIRSIDISTVGITKSQYYTSNIYRNQHQN
jgi:hypothetical protein